MSEDELDLELPEVPEDEELAELDDLLEGEVDDDLLGDIEEDDDEEDEDEEEDEDADLYDDVEPEDGFY